MPANAEAAPPPELADYLGVLKRQWVTVLCMIVAGLCGAALLLVILPKTYLATASIYLNPLPGQGDTPVTGSHVTDGVNLDTEAQLLTSSVVTGRARRILRTDDSDTTLRRRVSVTVPANSAVLNIDYRAGSSAAAVAGAGAFAQAYLDNRRETAVSGLSAQIAAVQTQLDEVAVHLRDLTQQLAGLPAGSAQRDLILAQQNVLGFRITNLDDRLVTLQAGNPSPGQLISRAAGPSGPDAPKWQLYLPAGAILGFLLGLLAAGVRDRRPRRLRRTRDMERLLGVAVVADLSDVAPAPGHLEAYQRLSTELLTTLGHGPWSVLVAGASPGSPAGRVAEDLALCLVRAGGRVALVPGDLSPVAAGGESDSASQDADGDPGDRTPGVVRTEIRTGVPLAEQLQVARATGPLEELRATSDFVVLSAAPVLSSVDGQSMAPLVDGVLLVVTLLGRTTAVREAIERLRLVHARLLGIVVLPADPRKSPSGGPSIRPRAAATPGEEHPQPSGRSEREARAPAPAS